MSLSAIIALFKSLADLGASPAVQKAVMDAISKYEGVPQSVLDAAIQASKDAPEPK